MSAELVVERLKLVGMHCATCAVTIEKKLKSLPGVADASVSFAGEEATVKYDPKRVSLGDIVRAVRDVGYDVYKEEAYFVTKNLVSVDEEPIIEERLKSLSGVIDVRASHVAKSVSVVFNPLTVNVEVVRELLESMGYEVVNIKKEVEVEDVEAGILKEESLRLKKVLTLSLALAVPLMTYMILGVLGVPVPLWEYRSFIGLTLSTPVLAIGGRRFFTGAYRALKNKTASMDTLVALGTGSAYVFSLLVMLGVIQAPETYFETSATVISFVLIGKYLELKMKVRTGEGPQGWGGG
ncbi:MAG: hypothetical protein DRJ31_10585 [Candidatus Methanomethylicota archaeon]|uniref:HMA domain-containing protein n=1 Tax=Thermoproteota archaeon TaxID=2056631 RepID=A0A497EK88_9CREN|nr:MAG: hypothetical protein DRJ31_10585 [Candidatus Verstraetearchaeota archaeon]